jgi:Beta-lactamase
MPQPFYEMEPHGRVTPGRPGWRFTRDHRSPRLRCQGARRHPTGTPDTLFMIGSITKPMTTMLAAALVVASHVDPAAVVLYLGRYSPFNVGRGEDYAAARSDCSGRWGAGQ